MSRWLIVLGSTLGVVLSAPAMGEPRIHPLTHDWLLEADSGRGSCTAVGPVNAQGTSLMILWNFAASEWVVALANQTWRLKVGQRIPARVFVDRDLPVKGRINVITQHAIALGVSKADSITSRHAFRELADGDQLRFEWSGGTVTPVSLAGSRNALRAAANCAAEITSQRQQVASRSASEAEARAVATPNRRNTAVAGYRFEVVPREEALKFLASHFAETGTKVRFLPAGQRHPNVVYYELEDGSVGWFSASRGDTPEADRFVQTALGAMSKLCNGRFSSTVDKVPTINGSVARRLLMACDNGPSAGRWSAPALCDIPQAS